MQEFSFYCCVDRFVAVFPAHTSSQKDFRPKEFTTPSTNVSHWFCETMLRQSCGDWLDVCNPAAPQLTAWRSLITCWHCQLHNWKVKGLIAREKVATPTPRWRVHQTVRLLKFVGEICTFLSAGHKLVTQMYRLYRSTTFRPIQIQRKTDYPHRFLIFSTRKNWWLVLCLLHQFLSGIRLLFGLGIEWDNVH